jgi:hypothetical protein
MMSVPNASSGADARPVRFRWKPRCRIVYAHCLVPKNQPGGVRMTRITCPYCNRIGLVRSERIFKGRSAISAYYCGGCTRSWEMADESRDLSPAEQQPPPPDAKTA